MDSDGRSEKLLAMSTVNSISYNEFIDTFGGVLERTELAAAAVWSYRPFNSLQELHGRFSSFIDELPTQGK